MRIQLDLRRTLASYCDLLRRRRRAKQTTLQKKSDFTTAAFDTDDLSSIHGLQGPKCSTWDFTAFPVLAPRRQRALKSSGSR